MRNSFIEEYNDNFQRIVGEDNQVNSRKKSYEKALLTWTILIQMHF